jgi:PAS domain S-box-containing protein
VLNIFNSDKSFTSVAFAGVKESIQKAISILGFKIEGKKWDYDPIREGKIAPSKTTVFDNLSQLVGASIPRSLVGLLEKTFHVEKAAIIKSLREDEPVGDFTLIFEKDAELLNRETAEAYADLTGMLIGRIKAEEQLLSKTEQYELVIGGTNDGIWDWNLASGELFLSKRWKMMLGYGDKELKGEFDTFLSLIFEADLGRVNDYIAAYLVGAKSEYSIEFQMKHKDGSLRWILAKAEAVRDAEGRPIRMAGSHSDITERKRAEADLRSAHERTHRHLDGIDPDGHRAGAVFG